MHRATYALTALVLICGQARAADPAAPLRQLRLRAPAPAAAPSAQQPAAAPPTAAPAPTSSSAAAPSPKPGATPPPSTTWSPASLAPPPASAAPAAPPPSAGAPPGPPGPPPPPPAGVQIYDPAPPGFFPGELVGEPPPPPEPRHIAPRTALWLGARVGWFIPFGDVWARTTQNARHWCALERLRLFRADVRARRRRALVAQLQRVRALGARSARVGQR